MSQSMRPSSASFEFEATGRHQDPCALAVKIRPRTASAARSRRPATASTAGRSGRQLQRPWSSPSLGRRGNGRPSSGLPAGRNPGVYGEQAFPARTFCASSSRPQSAPGRARLPALPKKPLSFDDLYAMAKQRALVKVREHQKAMQEELLHVDTLPFYQVTPPQEYTEWERSQRRAERAWAAQALSAVAATQQSSQQDSASRQPTLLESVGPSPPSLSRQSSKSQTASQQLAQLIEQRSSPPRSSPPGTPSQSTELAPGQVARDALRRTGSMVPRDTREVAHLRTDEYIREMRQIIEGGEHGSKSFLARRASGNVPTGKHVGGTAFSEVEMARMHVAFDNFSTSEHEVHIDDLSKPLLFQDYLRADPDVCIALANEVTPYSTLSFEEYVKFVDKFAAYEKEELRKEFNDFDTNHSGCLDVDEIKGVLSAFGITPLKDTLSDGVAIVDFDGSGELDFDEFISLLAIWRVTEGFTRKEIMALQEVFDRLATDVHMPGQPDHKEINAGRLSIAMVYLFGPQSHDLAQQFILDERFNGSRTDGSPGLSFMEFVIWARRLREAEIKEFRKKFQEADQDNSGFLGAPEITQTITSLGYKPLRCLINEVLEVVDCNSDQQLDFDEFVNLMKVFRATDGFCASEIAELTELFRRYESAVSGTVDCIQLLDILRFLGYVTNLDSVRRHLQSVDYDESNTLDLPQFLRLMRLFREEELEQALVEFNKQLKTVESEESFSQSLPVKMIHKALEALGYNQCIKKLEKTLLKFVGVTGLDFDGFVVIMDHCRKTLVNMRRTHAFFSEEEIEKFRTAFSIYDEDGSGDIEKLELSKLLQELGIPMGTKQDQKEMLVKMDLARDKARAAGVEETLVGTNGDASLTFHSFLFLLRMIHRTADHAEVDRDAMMIHRTKFTQAEITEFRDVFSFWADKIAHLERASKLMSEETPLEQPALAVLLSHDGSGEDHPKAASVSLDGMQRVIRSIGLHMNSDDKKVLWDKIYNLPRVDATKYGFFEFLLLMRWMLDTNFAEITSVIGT